MIKLVATDLDGTLFNSKSQIPQSAINAIEKYSKQGVHFAFCTGRGFMEMDEVIDRLPYMEYAITANGAYIFNAWSKKDISKSLINPIDILNIYNILKDRDMLFELYKDGMIYCEKKLREERANYIPIQFHDLINASRVLVDDIEDFIKKMDKGAIKLHTFFGTTTQRDITYENIKHLPFEIVSQSMNEIEINAKGVNKGNGISTLSKKLNISKEEIIGFGDNFNDMSMRNAVGTMIAMGNAVAPLKDIADFVTYSNDNDGMAFALDKFLQ